MDVLILQVTKSADLHLQCHQVIETNKHHLHHHTPLETLLFHSSSAIQYHRTILILHLPQNDVLSFYQQAALVGPILPQVMV